MSMSLFALSTPGQSQVLRLSISQDVQAEFEQTWRDQMRVFLSVDDEIEFDGNYRPEAGELLKISNFSDPYNLLTVATNPLSVPVFDSELHSVERIRALFTVTIDDPTPLVLMQLFEQKRVLAKDRLIFIFEGKTFQRLEHAGFILDSRLLAVIDSTSIKFENFYNLRRVFDMDEFFHEATEIELHAFLDHECFAAQNHAEVIDEADTLVRKKIALISQSGILDVVKPRKVRSTAKKFGLDIALDSTGRIILPGNRAELKRVLKFLDEDYYSAPLSGTKYVSNSKRRAAN